MGTGKLPYAHVCQIGDPILRNRTMTIEPEVVKLADFQKVQLYRCFSNNKCFVKFLIWKGNIFVT